MSAANIITKAKAAPLANVLAIMVLCGFLSLGIEGNENLNEFVDRMTEQNRQQNEGGEMCIDERFQSAFLSVSMS